MIESFSWEAWWRESRGIAQVSDDETMRARTASHGLTYRLDALIGQVLDCLRDSGLQDNTLIVYSADHGDHLGERGLRRKLHRSNARMLAKVLDGWEPEPNICRIRERRMDENIIDEWARTVRPRDEFRWQLAPSLNRLDASE